MNRDGVQSSIRRNLGIAADKTGKEPLAEQGIAEMMSDLYINFADPLNHNTLFTWHIMLNKGNNKLNDIGRYCTHKEPMHVVSVPFHDPSIHFEATPSYIVPTEIERFIDWFNTTSPDGTTPLSPLTRSAISNLYFVSVHPFEDGNGRIARALAEKVLSQSLKHPTLIALSHTIKIWSQRIL